MIAAERRIVDWSLALLGREAGEQGRVGAELLRASVQLACAAEVNQAALVYAVQDAAQLDIFTAHGFEITGIAAVLRQAGDGEAAIRVAGFGAAGIEEARAVS